MIIMEFFKKSRQCKHENFPPDKDTGYCPDCGELIENRWFIVRCACCGVKHKAIIKNGQIVPVEKFCHNCGGKDFVVERVNKINFIDINYAVLVKTTVPCEHFEFTQSWAESRETSNCTRKLLQQFR